MAILEKHCHRSSAFIYRPNLILYHTNVKFENILDKFLKHILNKFEFEPSRAKVTVAIFRKNIVIAVMPSFIIQFQYNFTQVVDMTIHQTNSRFSMMG